MPAYQIASRDRIGQGIDIAGMDLADPNWSITIHDRPLLKAHKQFPRRRDYSLPSSDLPSHYKKVPPLLSNGNVYHPRNLSTTPPHHPESILLDYSPSPVIREEPSEYGRDDSSNAETTILRSTVATPTHQKTPPTPDITPPRPEPLVRLQPVLINPPSISSRAESFKTAKEELSSDEETDTWSPSQRPSRQRWLHNIQTTRMEDWRAQPSPLAPADRHDLTPTKTIKRKPLPSETFATFDGSWDSKIEDPKSPLKASPSLNDILDNADNGGSLHSVTSPPSPLPTPPHSADAEQPAATPDPPLVRGKSLRDRLEESKMVRASDSTEKFARDIGWSHVYRSPELQNRINSWRLSGISTTSTVEAIVVDAETPPHRQQQLRHSRKNPSLRSASSPFPASNRSSLLSNPDSPHRLVHKRGQITNKLRWSIDSEASRKLTAMADIPKPDVIQVAVIPERKSSLQSSENSSRRDSASLSLSPTEQRLAIAHDGQRVGSHAVLRKKRPMSATLPVGASFESRGRGRHFPLTMPPRAMSLSAPTSRSNSRANSPNSEHLRLRRLAAEEDLHRTLERMESERSVARRYRPSQIRHGSSTQPVEADLDPYDNMRSPSLHTPFSPPSMDSASPGPVEISEARAVNLFAHNNHSLQIIDQFPQPDSRPVMLLNQSGATGPLSLEKPSTEQEVASLPRLLIDSPLRNPRDPPDPPVLKVIPPTPADLTPVENNERRLGLPPPEIHRRAGSLSRRFGSLTRPSLRTRRHSESLVKSLSRTLSLRSVRNVRAEEPRDANLHPFWRPRGFWDEFDDSDSDQDDYDRGVIVSNSLGVPQKRVVIDGPISLVRHLSDSSRRQLRNRGVTKRCSHGSLSQMRVGKSLHQILGLGHRRFPFMGLGDVPGRLPFSRREKEDAKREKTRQALREKIGPQIISTGDSRYPAYMP